VAPQIRPATQGRVPHETAGVEHLLKLHSLAGTHPESKAVTSLHHATLTGGYDNNIGPPARRRSRPALLAQASRRKDLR